MPFVNYLTERGTTVRGLPVMERENKNLTTLILAAGKGKRMKSDLPKVMHLLGGKPMLYYPLTLARQLKSTRIIVVIGHGAPMVREAFAGDDIFFAEQHLQLGTGHAVFMARDYLAETSGSVLILCGDVPLLRLQTVASFLNYHHKIEATVTVMTAEVPDPGAYGRIIKDGKGQVKKIVEARDASLEERQIKEINTGIYCAEAPFLYEAVGLLDNKNAQEEFYLTDIMAIAYTQGYKTAAFPVENTEEVMGINTPEELQKAEQILARGTLC